MCNIANLFSQNSWKKRTLFLILPIVVLRVVKYVCKILPDNKCPETEIPLLDTADFHSKNTTYTRTMADQESSLSKRYCSIHVACFNNAFNTNHTKAYQFSNNKLFTLNLVHIYNYLALNVYGTTDPCGTYLPTFGRSNTIVFDKKNNQLLYVQLPHVVECRDKPGQPY